jgi:hypothetical protein
MTSNMFNTFPRISMRNQSILSAPSVISISPSTPLLPPSRPRVSMVVSNKHMSGMTLRPETNILTLLLARNKCVRKNQRPVLTSVEITTKGLQPSKYKSPKITTTAELAPRIRMLTWLFSSLKPSSSWSFRNQKLKRALPHQSVDRIKRVFCPKIKCQRNLN